MQEEIKCKNLSGDLFFKLEEIKQLDKEKGVLETTSSITHGCTSLFSIICY